MSTFLTSLKRSGHLDDITMTIFNVGSRKVSSEDDYGSQDWGIFAPNLIIYAFDADADACDIANADLASRQVNWTEKHIPLALSDTVGEAILYVTKHPMCSSLFPPNEAYLSRFSELIEYMGLDFTIDIETTTIDDFCQKEGITEIDFLKVDVQGADLKVLQGAKEILESSILAIQTEVEFCELYLNQPLFSNIDSFLREREFSLFSLPVAFRHHQVSPIVSEINPGQLLWGDALYIRDLLEERVRKNLKQPDKILKLACIADILNFPDYALELLEYLTLNFGKNSKYNCANTIVEGLSQFPELLKQGLESLPVIAKIQEYLIV
ncbi:FkbM family methyltransferase [Phormidium sp. LEGE 05292]|uniref:FkbM family methyltransferase n=1 Tax=[Phormidium] sp. LEGE 05292 TaxID=767427 RepID=UPI00187FB91D|nr:FkbM family methyltransferase [Phormidium sp. LEGE 05292]MBE9225252.1 FkbM family methyltransferase [Phormidium sp. LEGE 05292]